MASRAMSAIFFLAYLLTFITPALAQSYEFATGKILCIPPGTNLLCTARITAVPVNYDVNPPLDGYYEIEIFDPACNNLMLGGSATGYYGSMCPNLHAPTCPCEQVPC
jgi:hypothetical protein